MGQPTMSNVIVPMSKFIAHVEGTRGTETSKYPEEEKETSIFQVAASERERVQTGIYSGVAGHAKDAASLVKIPGQVCHRG